MQLHSSFGRVIGELRSELVISPRSVVEVVSNEGGARIADVTGTDIED